MKIASKAIAPTRNKMQCHAMRFEYRYRDAANFKARGYVALRGNLSSAERDEIVAKLEDEELFVAEQIGVPALHEALYEFSNGPTSSDHCWHEFIAFSDSQLGAKDLEIWGTIEQLLERFRNVSEWDVRRSPHSEI